MANRGTGQGKAAGRSRRSFSRFLVSALAGGAVLYAIGFGIWSISTGTFGALNGIALAILAALGLAVLITRGRRGRDEREERQPTLPQPDLTVVVISLVTALIPLVVQIQASEGGPQDGSTTLVPCQERTQPEAPLGQPAKAPD